MWNYGFPILNGFPKTEKKSIISLCLSINHRNHHHPLFWPAKSRANQTIFVLPQPHAINAAVTALFHTQNEQQQRQHKS